MRHPRDQVDTCCRLHRRIHARTNAIRRPLEPDYRARRDVEVVLNLLVEIRDATDVLETLLQGSRPRPRVTFSNHLEPALSNVRFSSKG